MAWVEPKTDWSSGDNVTADDMNRICGNLNYLLDEERLTKVYTYKDYVFLTEWQAIASALGDVQTFLGMEADTPDNQTTAYNFNLVESYCEQYKPLVDAIRAQRSANKYVGEWYADTEIYSGGYA